MHKQACKAFGQITRLTEPDRETTIHGELTACNQRRPSKSQEVARAPFLEFLPPGQKHKAWNKLEGAGILPL